MSSSSSSQHHRALSWGSAVSNRPRSASPPSLTYHPTLIPTVPTPALVESVAGAAHYSGVKVDHEQLKKRRSSSYDAGDNHMVLKPSHSKVLDDLKELYGCRPTLEIFERSWSKDAEFEDPLSRCKGYQEYAAQWYALPKLFSDSRTLSIRVMSSTTTPNRFIFSLSQQYTARILKRRKTIDSIVVVDLDEDEKIIRVVDQWGGKDLPTRFGALFLRTLNAKITPWLVSVPRFRES